MTKVTLNGVEYDIKMGWRAAFEFQNATGKNAFNFIETFKEQKLEDVFQMIHAMMVAANRDKQVPSFDEFVDMLGNDAESAKIIDTFRTEYLAWVAPQAAEQNDQPEAAKKGKQSKNA